MHDASAQPLGVNTYACGGAEPEKPGKPANLAQYISDLVAINPDGVFMEVGPDGKPASHRYHDLFQRAQCIERFLSDRIEKNSPLILCYGQVSDYIPAAWSCLLGHRDFLPIAIAPLYRDPDAFAEQVAIKAAILGASSILTDSESADTLRDALSGQNVKIQIFETSKIDETTYPARKAPCVAEDETGLSNIFIETSGSTGIPKIAKLSGTSLINRFFDGIGRDERVMLNVLSSQSVGGMRLLLPLGRRNIFLNPSLLMVNPKIWFDIVLAYGVTDVGLTNSMVSRLLRHIDAGGICDARSLKRLAFGAEPIQQTIVAQFLSALMRAGMAESSVSLVYSMTETGPIFTSTLPVSVVAQGGGQQDFGYIFSRCAASWSVRVRKDDGSLAPYGEIGVVEVSSPTRLFSGYLASRNDFSPDGWFSTGDRGVLSAGGLCLVGRDKNTIIVHGRKITCEEIEARIAAPLAAENLTGIAVAYRTRDDETDRLGLIISGDKYDTSRLQEIVLQLSAAISRAFGLSVGFIGLKPQDEIPRTLTGKIQRQDLVNDILSGNLNTVTQSIAPASKIKRDWASGRAGALARIWASALKMNDMPDLTLDFYTSGGDSLAMMDLLVQVRREFGVSIPTRGFLKSPDLAGLIRLVETAPGAAEVEEADLSARNLVLLKHKLLSEAWEGERCSDDGLILRHNAKGSRNPIFWVFQLQQEFDALAYALGPDQPLYGMRSLTGIVPTADYAPHHRDIGERLAREMRDLVADRQFILGGNCQAAIIALDVARRLVAANRPASTLVLMEWSFSYGRFEWPTLMLYGRNSYTAAWFRGDDRQQAWRRDFPLARAAELPGPHGQFFTPAHIAGLADHLLGLTA